MKKRSTMKINDPHIVSRVKNYLAENVDKTFVDVSQMARSLKERYREYNNRSDSAFCQLVEAAYKVVLQSYGLDEGSSSEEEESDDLEMLDDSNQVLNDQLIAMYKLQDKKQSENQHKHGEKAGDLIDISSDEDGGSKTAKLPKLGDQITIIRRNQMESQTKLGNNVDNEKKSASKSNDRKRKQEPTVKQSLLKRKPLEEFKVSSITFTDVGGISDILSQLCDLILHMKHPEVYKTLGVKAPRGALLHGPPGTGKTLIANAISGKLNIPIVSVAGTELVGGVSGESEERIRELFEKANSAAPCVLFIDEIDAICGNRLNAQKDMERRMVAQLLSCIDNLDTEQSQVLLLAATNNPDSLDPALRRAGRLEQEIALGIPSLNARKEILQILTKNLTLGEDVNFESLAQLTPGFVGADLQALINKACTFAIKRVFQTLKESEHKVVAKDQPEESAKNEPLQNGKEGETEEVKATEESSKEEPEIDVVTETDTKEDTAEELVQKASSEVETKPDEPENKPIEEPVKSSTNDIMALLDDPKPYTGEQLAGMTVVQNDFLEALRTIKPCAIREGIITVPNVTWDDVGSLKLVRKELQLAVLAPVKYPEQLKMLGLSVPSGILLCGPPGCGKTLLAKAVANEAGINFISVKGPELLNMYVGESEKAVRTCFQRARNSAPCVIFFDEFDSLCPRRNQNENSGATRVVNQLLTEMDGIESRGGVFILAASNRPDIIDPAVLRPGRLDRVMYVGIPQVEDRVDIIRKLTKNGTKPPLASDVNLGELAALTENYTGADLAGLVRQAATQALTSCIEENMMEGEIVVKFDHFKTALTKCKPSVSSKELQHYERLRYKYTTDVVCDEMETEPTNEESMDTV